MGINRLIPFLKEHNVLKTFTNWPLGSSVAIDVPIFAHKFIYTERTYQGLETRFLLWAKELKETCVPIFVFDGSKLPLKDQERQRRTSARARTSFLQQAKRSEAYESLSRELHIDVVCNINYNTTKSLEASNNEALHNEALQNDQDNLIVLRPDELFSGLMIPTSVEYAKLKSKLHEEGFRVESAAFEAEAKCAQLVKTNQAWCSLTEDTDSLAFGCPRTVLKFFSNEPVLADLDHILTSLNFTENQFIDLCCLFGTDFCENIYKIGPKNAYLLLDKHKSVSVIFDKEYAFWQPKTKESADTFKRIYAEAFDCFKTSCFEP